MKFQESTLPKDLYYLFNPRGLAVVGASSDPSKIGHTILKNIIEGGYSGNIYPVNPKKGIILGKKVFARLTEVNSQIDVCVISVPALVVFDVLKDCAIKKIPFVLIISSGFSEIGNKEEEEKIKNFAKESGIRLLGPNIFGIFSAKSYLNATFSGSCVSRGSVAMISQSGALGLSLMAKSVSESFGLSAMVSLGNKADLDESDFLEYFGKDKTAKEIFIYIEGVTDGERFFRTLSKVAGKKLVLIIKSGSSVRGAAAAFSHTGSLAGEDIVFDSLISRAGAIRVTDLNQAFSLLNLHSLAGDVKKSETLIVTNGGGVGVLASDSAEKFNVPLFSDLNYLKNKYGAFIPSFGSVKNPIDITGQALAEDYLKILEASLKDPKIKILVCLCCQTAILDNRKLSKYLLRVASKFKKARKNFIFCFIGARDIESHFRNQKYPFYQSVESVFSDISKLNKEKNLVSKSKVLAKLPYKEINNLLENVAMEKRNTLYSFELAELLDKLSINRPKSFFSEEYKDALNSAKKIGFPVVLKIVSKNIIHKTEAGGVKLDIKNELEFKKSFNRLMQDAGRYDSHAIIEGVDVSEMVSGGFELIVGAKKDPIFGTLITCGMGGKYVDIFKDISLRHFDGVKETIFQMFNELKIRPILRGFRGESSMDIPSAVEVVYKLGSLVDKSDLVKEIEINPLIIEKDKVIALDFRVIL